MQTTILTTISRNYVTSIRKLETAHAMLKALRQRVKPTARATQLDVTKAYVALKQGPKASQVDKWLEQWESTYTEAKDLDLLDVLSERPLYDFLEAVREINPGFADH